MSTGAGRAVVRDDPVRSGPVRARRAPATAEDAVGHCFRGDVVAAVGHRRRGAAGAGAGSTKRGAIRAGGVAVLARGSA